MMRTQAGVGLVVGTPAYMSPEQSRGEPIDRTSDNWAFGCVLFEMLTGSQAFSGRTITDVVSGILRTDPPWERLPADTPLPLRLLLRRCLQKDRVKRLQFAADARVEIDQLLTDPLATAKPAPVSPRRSGAVAAWTSAAVLAVLLALVSIPAALYFRPGPAGRLVQFELAPPPRTSTFAISPDGRRMSFVAPNPPNGAAIWLGSLESPTVSVLAGTENVIRHAWSRDSARIAFTVRGEGAFGKPKLKVIDIAGGAPRTLADSGGPGGTIPAWGRDDVIVFQGEKSIIRKVSVAGGDPSDLTALDSSAGETSHTYPSFLPDGRHFLYWATTGARRGRIYIGSVDSTARTPPLMDDAQSMAVYAEPGYVLYVVDRVLKARPFDPRSRVFTGEPVTVADQVPSSASGLAGFAASDDGTLVYLQAPRGQPTAVFTWSDRSGATNGLLCTRFLGIREGWRLSPDGRQAAVLVMPGNTILICDLERDQSVRDTSDTSGQANPVWSPDGVNLVYQSIRGAGPGQTAIHQRAANGATGVQVLVPAEPETTLAPLDWSRDGQWLVFSKEKRPAGGAAGSRNRDIWLLPLAGVRTPRPYVDAGTDETQAAVSPDGRYLAYAASGLTVTSSYAIVVQTFPEAAGGKWTISTSGCCPRWTRDGKELLYVNADRHIVSVPVRTTPTFQPGREVVLEALTPSFRRPMGEIGGAYTYDIAPDGRFLMTTAPAARAAEEDGENSRSITVVLNWATGLKH